MLGTRSSFSHTAKVADLTGSHAREQRSPDLERARAHVRPNAHVVELNFNDSALRSFGCLVEVGLADRSFQIHTAHLKRPLSILTVRD